MSSTTNTIINPKPCNYNCDTRIYWNVSENAYWEVFSKKKHVCPNRSNKITTTNNNTNNASNVNHSFYNKKPWISNPKMSNSLELLTGPILDIQRKYEIFRVAFFITSILSCVTFKTFFFLFILVFMYINHIHIQFYYIFILYTTISLA